MTAGQRRNETSPPGPPAPRRGSGVRRIAGSKGVATNRRTFGESYRLTNEIVTSTGWAHSSAERRRRLLSVRGWPWHQHDGQGNEPGEPEDAGGVERLPCPVGTAASSVTAVTMPPHLSQRGSTRPTTMANPKPAALTTNGRWANTKASCGAFMILTVATAAPLVSSAQTGLPP